MSVNPTHLYNAAGTYSASLLLTSEKGCLDTLTVSVIVDVLPSAAITAGGSLSFCAGDSVALSGPAGTFNYLWSTGATTSSITATTAGTYVLTVTDPSSGCSGMDSVEVTINSSPVVFAGNDTTLSLGNTIQLNATGIGVLSWSWFPNTGLTNASIPNPLASPVVTTVYQLIGTDINGCSDEDSITITVIMDYNVVISNLMTPNDDGFNDRWIVGNIENYPNTEVIVVNREGSVVFSSDSYDNNWDGTNPSGQALPDGTYYYILKFADNTDKIYKGSVTILKQK
jgi:gliding motility-associated-like protein